MNARDGHFVNRLLGLPARLAGVAALCLASSACISNPFVDAQVDPRSPIAKEVASAVKPDAATPTFASVPSRPKDVRPVRQFGVAAQQVDRAAANLAAQTADDKFTLNDTETFAAQAQAAAGPDNGPTTAQAAAETDAFAAAMRKRATPPPQAKHQ
jgi:hypothetical protein